jgi:hypothetical protein
MSIPAVPLADARAFARRGRLVRALHLAVAAAVVGAAVLAFDAAHALRVTPSPPLPADGSGIVVLDLSASISSDTYARIAATLDRLIGSDGHYGLILFSDTAYQALPPGTPAAELRPFRRFFTVPPQTRPGALPELPASPWAASFSSGTRISTGLQLALDVVRADRLARPSVLLVSDLDDDTGDIGRLARVAGTYRSAGIPLHVVGLNAHPEDEAFLRGLVPPGATFTAAGLPGDADAGLSRGTSWPLVGAAALLALALGGYLWIGLPMRWRASQ